MNNTLHNSLDATDRAHHALTTHRRAWAVAIAALAAAAILGAQGCAALVGGAAGGAAGYVAGHEAADDDD